MFAFFALSEKRAWKALLSGEAYSSEYLRSDKKLLLEAIHIITHLFCCFLNSLSPVTLQGEVFQRQEAEWRVRDPCGTGMIDLT